MTYEDVKPFPPELFTIPAQESDIYVGSLLLYHGFEYIKILKIGKRTVWYSEYDIERMDGQEEVDWPLDADFVIGMKVIPALLREVAIANNMLVAS